jgi:P27 family predicted phage terminase small subunit
MTRPDANTKPPSDFDRQAQILWHRLQRQARRQGTWQLGDEEILESLVRNVIRAREAREAAKDQSYVRGGNGQLAPHPGLKVADQAEAAIHRYATALILTPEARSRHGIKGVERSDNGVPWTAGLVEAG